MMASDTGGRTPGHRGVRMLLRDALAVWAPLCVALLVGGLAGIGAVSFADELGIELSARVEAIPVILSVVAFGFRGAVQSGNRLSLLLARHDPLNPGAEG